MEECCMTCRHKYSLDKVDYKRIGRADMHTHLAGYICIALADEGTAEWMVGINPECGMCECYEPKEG